MADKVLLFSVSFRVFTAIDQTDGILPKNFPSLSSWLQIHDLTIPANHVPSFAAQHIHVLSRTRGISVALQRDTTNPNVFIATLYLDEDLVGVPQCVLHGSESSLTVLNHMFCQYDCCGDLPAGCVIDANCGFLCCNDNCASRHRTIVRRKDYHLDNVFSDCSAADEINAVRDTNVMMNVNPRIGQKDLLSRLPYDIHLRIIANLPVSDVRSLHSTSRLFRAATRYFVPGLNIQLYPHQRAGLDRMQRMEGAYGKRRTMPLLRAIQNQDMYPFCVLPLKLFADLYDGSMYIHSHLPTIPVMRGGILADEPGLGKTVTAIALMLKSSDQRSKPPEGKVEQVMQITCSPVKKRKRSKEVESDSSPQTVSVRYYEEIILGGKPFVRKSVPARRTRILTSCDYATSEQVGLQYMNVSTSFESAGIMETRSSAQIRRCAPTTERMDVLLTNCNLVICPKPLVEHWVSQVEGLTSGRLRVLAVRKFSDLPSEIELALDYDVVVLSFTVISWLNERMKNSIPSLFRVRFLRFLIDEGHEMGGRSEADLVFTYCNSIKSERRWILTGTPTPSNPYSDVRFLRPLLVFIREPTYGMDGATWLKLIQKPYGQYRPESLARLKELLREIMIRSEKSTISSIPKCNVKDVFLDFSEQAARSYNELVSVAARNLLLGDWLSETHSESLLNEINTNLCHELVGNIRQACVFGGGFTRMDVTRDDVAKALDQLYATRERGHGALRDIGDNDIELEGVTKNRVGIELEGKIYYGRLAEIADCFLRGGNCYNCHERTRVPYLTPCAHVICTQCILSDRNRCPLKSCRTEYALDKQGVPEELIELQPSIVLGRWNTEYEATSPKMEYLIDKLKGTESNNEVINEKIVTRRKKVIVYSQFDSHLMRVAVDIRNVPELCDCYTELYVNRCDISRDRNLDKFINYELNQFRNHDKKFILLLGKKYGSVGLDLSFVEHIYLLEPFWDIALEKQVISRAHRLGAKAPIHVERIIMKGSIEEDSMVHGASLREDDVVGELQNVRQVGKEIAIRRGRDVLLRLTRVQPPDELVEQSSPVTPPSKRTFPLLEYHTISKETAKQFGNKRSAPSRATPRKRKVRRKLWSK